MADVPSGPSWTLLPTMRIKKNSASTNYATACPHTKRQVRKNESNSILLELSSLESSFQKCKMSKALSSLPVALRASRIGLKPMICREHGCVTGVSMRQITDHKPRILAWELASTLYDLDTDSNVK
jgi:hypothetical protein